MGVHEQMGKRKKTTTVTERGGEGEKERDVRSERETREVNSEATKEDASRVSSRRVAVPDTCIEGKELCSH